MSANPAGLSAPVDAAKKPIVLFVDDDPKILASLERLLVNEPYELLTTDSQAQAIRWVEEKHISLIISDQVQPLQLGTKLLEQVRTRSPATLVAILTAYPEGGALLQKRSGEDLLVILKPWDNEELKKTLRTLLRNSFGTRTILT